jgi:hypothetical protein
LEPWNLLDLGFRFGNRVQQNNDSDVNGAEKLRGSARLAREQCESLFCCSDFQNSFEEGNRSWTPWTSNFLVFPFGNRVQQNNDSDHYGAKKLSNVPVRYPYSLSTVKNNRIVFFSNKPSKSKPCSYIREATWAVEAQGS